VTAGNVAMSSSGRAFVDVVRRRLEAAQRAAQVQGS
jgi:hypothetical protein